MTAAGAYVRRDGQPNRETGTPVSIYDARHPESVFDPGGGRWIVFCETHGTLLNVPSLADAERFASTPSNHCEPCAALVRALTWCARDGLWEWECGRDGCHRTVVGRTNHVCPECGWDRWWKAEPPGEPRTRQAVGPATPPDAPVAPTAPQDPPLRVGSIARIVGGYPEQYEGQRVRIIGFGESPSAGPFARCIDHDDDVTYRAIPLANLREVR